MLSVFSGRASRATKGSPCALAVACCEPLESRRLMTNDKTLWGYVYCDKDNDGYKDSNESGISGVYIKLTGTDRLGAVTRWTQTNSSGFYQFTQLNPGTYNLKEYQPSGTTDGKDSLGRLYDAVTGAEVGFRGVKSNDLFSNIQIPAGNPVIGKKYNFGEICEKTGREGLTPGFWKNHTNVWGPTGLSPNQTLESVFNVPDSYGLDNKTLLQALNFEGGSGTSGAARNLLRHAVAALLNAKHPNVDYALTSGSIISQVNSALASKNKTTIETLKNQLDHYNNFGGGIDAHGNPI